MAKRIADLGWHVQLFMTAEQIVDNADMLGRLPTTIVFDHMGHLTLPAGLDHPAYMVIRGLIDKGRTWVKLRFFEIFLSGGTPAIYSGFLAREVPIKVWLWRLFPLTHRCWRETPIPTADR
jgi:Amidohydrolase